MENNDQFLNEPVDPEWEIPYSPEEMKRIRKHLRRHNWKIILTSVVLAIALLLGCINVIIPAVEMLYWNPSESTYGSHTDLETMLHTYTDLFTPGYNTFSVSYQRRGFASYDLEIKVFSTAQDNVISATGALNRNILSMDQHFFDPMNKYYPFHRWSTPDYTPNSMDIETLRQRLIALPEYIRLEATICFPSDFSMEELMEFRSEQDNLLITWVGVRGLAVPDPIVPLVGMDPFTGGTVFDGFLMEYRYFDASQISESTHLEQHFKTRLQYYIDQVEKGQGFYQYDVDTLNDILTYVEENGVYTYGCVVTASPQTLLALLDNGIVCDIGLVDCWIDISR